MAEDRLDKLINSAGETYRLPPEPALDDMWRAIDAELDARAADRRTPATRGGQWRVAGLAAAAALVIGVGVGRWSAAPATQTPAVVAAAPSTDGVTPVSDVSYMSEPLQRTTTSYLGETAALLKELQNNPKGTYAAQAMTLLSTTRLLLDSPAATDGRLNTLLEDLELILAQIATLQNAGSTERRREDLQMIRSALVDRDVMPRVHTAAVTLASFDD